jgi:hypothetical protein
MYNLTASVLTALDSNWRKKLLGATSDGASNMPAAIQAGKVV